MEFDRAFLSTKFKASGPTKFNDNKLCAAVFGTQGSTAERKILTRRKILAERGILKFKDASAR
ncbi:hypothetical protein [uncultured Campylobacter sp.]|uniref:hypothetical protein n=1 Tax=uncultured Campylobacter sp. TaxID=218934 RepID=UPI002637FB65|nr:hypothetical protein [uncultured Campylobacter sp.]